MDSYGATKFDSCQFDAVDITFLSLQPWQAQPNVLLSWWELQKFSASVFFSIGQYLALAKKAPDKFSRETRIEPVLNLAEDVKGRVIQAVQINCEQIGLVISVKCVQSIVSNLSAGTTVGDYVDSIGHLEDLIRWEMSEKLFMFVPSDRAEFYGQNDLFGKDVNDKFPEAQFDVAEAGNSYAFGRATACVFHLMRVLEYAVQQFGAKLGVTVVDEKNWHNILEEVDKKIKTLPQKDPATVELAETSSMLYHVKVAWRNPTMHPKQTYTPEEAKNILIATRIFMQQLAKVV